MPRAVRALGVALLFGAGSIVPACILPDFTVAPATSEDGGGSETGTADGPNVPDANGDALVQPDGALVCPANTGNCDGNDANGCETDLRVTTAHCGACGRNCGNTSCSDGECRAEPLASNLAQPFGLELAGPRLVWHEGTAISGCRAADCATSKAILVDITGSLVSTPTGATSPRVIAFNNGKFYFSQCLSNTNDCSVAGCDIAGCKATGATHVTPPNGNRRATLLVGGAGAIFTHHGLDGLVRSALPTGPVSFENSKYGIGDQLQAFHLDATNALWLDDNASLANPVGGLFRVPAAGGVAPVRLLPPPVKHLAVEGGVAFTSTGTSANAASIVACEIAGCSSSGTVLANNQPYVSDIAADARAVYWSVVGAADPRTNATAVGSVLRCMRPACAGGPTKIADGLLNPVSVRIDDTHVYWVERGAPAIATGVITRKRR